MKKRGFIIFVVIVLLFSCVMPFAACKRHNREDSTSEDTAPKEYTIQYTDDDGTHTITVTDGMPYVLDIVPEKNGYTFMGLYDAEVGGTQYVSSAGASLSPFTAKKNMVLFPQFKAKKYTVILDYQGAAVTGSRQLEVAYGSSLPELPKNLTGEHKEFAGWYTEKNCEGTQIADKYGLIPAVSVLNDVNFNLSGEYVYLYAGFKAETFTVTCNFETGMETEDLQVSYGTSANQITPKTRVNGNAPLTWSLTRDGEVWNGKVESDMVLYAVEYAPVIEFDCNGGNEISPLVARAGSTISLPTPTKAVSKFDYWEDMQGNKYSSTTMPSSSISLKAVWQAKLVFDSNGGTEVDSISVAAGEKITLPMPEKEGFVFAGWYTTEKERYTKTTMPSAGIMLKAGWYKEKEALIVQCSADKRLGGYDTTGIKMYDSLTLNLSQYLPDNFNGVVKVDAQFKMKHTEASLSRKWIVDLLFYSTSTASDGYKVMEKSYTISSTDYADFSYQFIANITGNKIYGATKVSNSSGYVYITDYRYNLIYPDVTKLYL